MRVGIMGGTLDPIHNGHIQVARAALDLLKLDRVMLLPAGDPPHKKRLTSPKDRFEMVRLAAREMENMFPCGIEINRSGTTYTVDTLRELHQKNPSVEWYYLIGADTLDVLDSWRAFDEVAKMCTFAVTGRADSYASCVRASELTERYGARFELLEFNGPSISSSEIRRFVAEGQSIDAFVPTSVCEYIKDHGLYICNCSIEALRTSLECSLKPSRYVHTLGVAETAKRLAPRYGVDPMRAEIAALLHDCAKHLSPEEMQKLVQENIPDVDEREMQNESVLHAPAGAAYASKIFGVRDKAILSAIRKHTLGDKHMSAMDALIYTADFIEPNRSQFEGLDEARQLAEKDIFAAMCRCAQLTNEYLKKQGKTPHSRSVAMLAAFSS